MARNSGLKNMDTPTNNVRDVDMNGAATGTLSSLHAPKATIDTHEPELQTKHIPPHYLGVALVAYGSALVLTGVMIPIVASIIMAGIYLAHPTVSLFGLDPTLKWFPLLSSSIITLIIWLFAALCTSF